MPVLVVKVIIADRPIENSTLQGTEIVGTTTRTRPVLNRATFREVRQPATMR